MDPKAAYVSLIVAVAAAQGSAVAQGTGTPYTVPPGRTLAPPEFLSGSELDQYNDTYPALKSFWGDDTISRFFKHAADGTLDQVRPLVAELCNEWRNPDSHLPIDGDITVPPGIVLHLKRLCR
jgi:hypothetical protein